MNLAVFLSSGEGFEDLKRSGQDTRFKKYYLENYAKNFEKVYVFSYINEKYNDLPKNVILVPNNLNMHRYLYGLLMPFIHYKILKECGIVRAFHLLGTLPAIVNKIFFNKSFIYNYGYDYVSFAQIDKKHLQIPFITTVRFFANLFAYKIIGVTPSIFKDMPENKMIYIPNGVDTNIFKPGKKANNKRKIVLSVGRLEKQKNYQSLIKALPGLDVKLLLIGKGSLKEELIKLAEEKMVDLVIIDQVGNEDLPKYYNQADIFVLPSFNEGFAKVLIEAMACKLPVITSKVGGLREIIKDGLTGLFCTTDESSIREKVIYLIDNPKKAESLARNGREDVVKNYDINILIEKEIQILNENKTV